MDKLLIKKMDNNAPEPFYATEGSAAVDLCAYITEPVIIKAGQHALVPTGIAIKLPSENYVGLVFARSGLAVKSKIALSNGVGVIDSDYTGEIKVALINTSDCSYTVNSGDRIAQLAIMPLCRLPIVFTDTLPSTDRGAGGFGSTGK